MSHPKYIFTILCSFLLVACGSEQEISIPVDKTAIDVSAVMNKQHSRSTFEGGDFVTGDIFTLYENNPSLTANSSSYIYNGTWTGSPGLYWNDLSIWKNDGSLKTTNSYFTAVLKNGGTLNLTGEPHSFSIQTAPKSESDFLKSDHLVAYTEALPLEPLKLIFHHAFARLVIEITDKTSGADNPDILSESTIIQLNAFTENKIEFNSLTKVTTVETEGSENVVTLFRKNPPTDKTYTYEIILPAQSLRTTNSKLTVSGNTNGKTYIYDLSGLTISIGGSGTDLLQQDYTTKIELSIEKTELVVNEVKVTKWVNKTADGPATPNDYPIIEIGGDDDDGGNISEPGDDFAGKTIRLTDHITLEELKKRLPIPLGTKAIPFRGTFDGQGFSITDVDIEKDEDFLGVFGYTDGATIKNLNVQGIKIKNQSKNSSTATGGLAGYVNNTTIFNCHATYSEGVHAAYDNAGGLVGYANAYTKIQNSSSDTPVKADHDYAGGLVGVTKRGTFITHSFSIKNNSTDGSYAVVAGNYYAGGLVGACFDTDIDHCYSWSDAKATRYAGGFVARFESSQGTNNLINCYAAGPKVSGGANQAGMVSYIEIKPGAPNKCYWNSKLGTGFIGLYQGGENSSFTLTTTMAAMGNVLNGLNNDKEEGEWELTRTNYGDGYVLPTLKINKGKAEPKTVG